MPHFPKWTQSNNDIPMTYELFFGEWNDGSMARISNAPPCERLRNLNPTRRGWWSFVGNPLAPRTAYAQLKTICLKCGDVNKSAWAAWVARASFGTINQPSPQRAMEEFCKFLKACEKCLDKIKEVPVVSTRGTEENDVLKQMAGGEKGFWIVCDLSDDTYEHVRGAATSSMSKGWHASSNCDDIFVHLSCRCFACKL